MDSDAFFRHCVSDDLLLCVRHRLNKLYRLTMYCIIWLAEGVARLFEIAEPGTLFMVVLQGDMYPLTFFSDKKQRSRYI